MSYRPLRCLLLGVAIFGAMLPGPVVGQQETAYFYPSPHTSLARTRQLLDAADLRVMLPLGFRALGPEAAAAGLAGRPGTLSSRQYADPEGGRIELAVLEGVSSRYDFAVYSPPEAPSPRLVAVYERLLDLIGQAAAYDSGQAELGYQMFRLGHIDADRAVALLKAMGYGTVEFEEKSKGKSDRPEEIFELVQGKEKDLPLVVKVLNASKTSPLAPDPEEKKSRSSSSSSSSRSKGIEGAPQLGGDHLHGATEGAPEERLLIVYDQRDHEALEKLLNLLKSHIDRPAHQIVIEALVIEVNTSRLRDLGVEVGATHDNADARFERSDTGLDLPFTFLLTRNGFGDFVDFKAKLEALTVGGAAEVLSSPSVLVLNDRQARIQVGQQIPVVRSTTTVSTTTSSVEYFPIGIVLNLRPRISPDGSEVTMQIQTIISSVSQSTELGSGGGSSQVAFAPVVDNRQVETYVRVADGTPFIIGGLLSTDNSHRRVSVPYLSGIPLLGRIFQRERRETDQREVIVVITPHIVPLEERSFSYLIPKDSDLFDRFDTRLFRNAYRVRDDEVWDLKFVQESPVLTDLKARLARAVAERPLLGRQATVRRFLNGEIPGEEVLVRRMLGDIVEKLEFGQEIDLAKTFFFEAVSSANPGQRFNDRGLNDVLAPALAAPDKAVMLTYKAQDRPQAGQPFTYPVAVVRDTVVAADEALAFLRRANPVDTEGRPLEWSIVLAGPADVERLQRALILKRVLELNERQPLTLQSFKPGLQVLFPSREDMRNRYHLVDREVAQLFYETAPDQYYPAFQRIFERAVAEVEGVLEEER